MKKQHKGKLKTEFCQIPITELPYQATKLCENNASDQYPKASLSSNFINNLLFLIVFQTSTAKESPTNPSQPSL